MNFPYTYRAFGLQVVSELPVTGFEPAPVSTADVTILTGEVPDNLPDAVNKGVLYESGESGFLLHVENVARYHVTGGKLITVQLLGDATPGEVSAFISGSSFGALLHQRRMLPLHACTMLFQGKGIVICGVSGVGKSTFAAALMKSGATLVADDVSAIDFSGGQPAVRPSFPMIRIWADSLKHLGLSEHGLEPVRGELRKYYLPVDAFTTQPVTVSRMLVLGAHNKEEMETKDLHGIEKFQALKRHTYFFRGIPKTGLEKNHFSLVNQLAASVPLTLLIRSNREFNTDRLVEYIRNQ